MHFLLQSVRIETAPDPRSPAPPVDDLLRIYLGQSRGSRGRSLTVATPSPTSTTSGTTWAISPEVGQRFQMRAALPSTMRSRSSSGTPSNVSSITVNDLGHVDTGCG